MPVNRRWNEDKAGKAGKDPITLGTESVVTITSEDGVDSVVRLKSENEGSSFALIQATSSGGLPVTYSISGTDASKFEINATTGALRFAWGSTPNYEAPGDSDGNNIYLVTVTASDGIGSDQQDWSIQILNVNEAPVFTSYGGSASASVSIAENNIHAGTFAAADPEGMTFLSYAIVGGADAALFTVNPWNGVLVFKSNPDFEAPRDSGANNVYDVIVRAYDGALTVTQSLAVTVTNAASESSFTGTTSGNVMNGTGSNDVIMGLDSSDTLSGLGGDDLLDGGTGSDYLIGGAGSDQLLGGAGLDRFQFDSASDSAVGAADTIWDFIRNQGDRILLSGVDSNSLVAGDQAFTFISTAAFSGAAGELRYVKSGGNTAVYGDLDGDAIADFQININGEHNLSSADFVL